MKVEVSLNDEKRGVELLFSEELPNGLADRLKEFGFKQGFRQPLKWYAPQHPAYINYANELKEALLKDRAFLSVDIQPSFAPTEENIDHNKFSYVTISYNDGVGKEQSSYVVFDSYKAIATSIATRFGKKKYGASFKEVDVSPRNYKRKARALLKEGKVITGEYNNIPSPKEESSSSEKHRPQPKEKQAQATTPTEVTVTDLLDTKEKALKHIPASSKYDGELIVVRDGSHTYKFRWQGDKDGKAILLEGSPPNKKVEVEGQTNGHTNGHASKDELINFYKWSSKKKSNTLMDIQREAFEGWIRKKYPNITTQEIDSLWSQVEDDVKEYDEMLKVYKASSPSKKKVSEILISTEKIDTAPGYNLDKGEKFSNWTDANTYAWKLSKALFEEAAYLIKWEDGTVLTGIIPIRKNFTEAAPNLSDIIFYENARIVFIEGDANSEHLRIATRIIQNYSLYDESKPENTNTPQKSKRAGIKKLRPSKYPEYLHSSEALPHIQAGYLDAYQFNVPPFMSGGKYYKGFQTTIYIINANDYIKWDIEPEGLARIESKTREPITSDGERVELLHLQLPDQDMQEHQWAIQYGINGKVEGVITLSSAWVRLMQKYHPKELANYEVTKDEYEQLLNPERKNKNNSTNQSAWQLTPLEYQQQRAIEKTGSAMVLDAADKRGHEAIVIKALNEGKEIPQKVLDHYPHVVDADSKPTKPVPPKYDYIDRVVAYMHEKYANGERPTKSQIEKIANELEVPNMGMMWEATELSWLLWYKNIYNEQIPFEDRLAKMIHFWNKIQPTYAYSDSSKEIYKQYSTPCPIGAIVAQYTCMDTAKKIFEPSAGNGLLLVGADPQKAHVNEIDQTRLASLKFQGFNKITSLNATDPFPDEMAKKYDVVVTNPPFARWEDEKFDKELIVRKYFNNHVGLAKHIRLEHLMAGLALYSMKDTGKAAIIIMGHVYFGRDGFIAKYRPFFNWLFRHYQVDDVINMNSFKLYNKQGAIEKTMLILVGGRKAKPGGVAPTQKEAAHLYDMVNSFTELWDRAKEHIHCDIDQVIDQLKIEVNIPSKEDTPPNMECYIEYLDAKNRFKPTKKEFKDYDSALVWMKENFEKWDLDMIKCY